MPLYSYRAKDEKASCQHCKNGFEVLQSIKDDALTKCPKCGNEVVKIFGTIQIKERKSTSKILSDDNLKKHGFQKLVREENGYKRIV